MTEPDSSKKSLANTVTQCDLVKRALHLHDIISKFPGKTDREIMKDLFNEPVVSDTLQKTASDLQKFVSKVAKMHQTFEEQLINPLQVTGHGNLEGRALLDHESSDEKDKQVVQPAVVPPQEQPQNVEQQQSRKKKKRSRTRAQRKQKKAAKLASGMQSMEIKMDVMESDCEFDWEDML
eukprot:jgi/Botrbrau1/5882/Bobra.0366s0060.1